MGEMSPPSAADYANHMAYEAIRMERESRANATEQAERIAHLEARVARLERLAPDTSPTLDRY